MFGEKSPFDKKWLLSGVDPASLSENSIDNDMWDREDWDYVEKSIPALRNKVRDLMEVIKTAHPLMADYFWSILKAEPNQHGLDALRPDHIPNWHVIHQIMQLPEWHELRRACQGDIVGAAMAAIQAEHDLATLAEQQKKRQEQAEDLQDKMTELAEARIEQASIEELLNDLDPELDEEAEAQAQALAEKLQEQLDAVQQAEQAVEDAAAELEAGMESDMPAIAATMSEAMSEAAAEQRESNESARAFGTEHAELKKMSVAERMALAKKLNNPRIAQIAEVFGAIEEMRFSIQKRKVDYIPEEIHDVTMGRDLKRVLAVELMRLVDPVRRALFLRDFHSGRLLQYDLQGIETKSKGGIIYQQDDSGSMDGEKSIWAAALGLNLLNVAKEQNRSFVGIHFGSRGHTKIMVFRKPEDFSPDRIIEFTEVFYGGGTDFETPMDEAVKFLEQEHADSGRVSADIVMCTDGEARVGDPWFRNFREIQERLDFAVWGVQVGRDYGYGTLKKLTDDKVLTVRDFVSGDDVQSLLRGLV
jgi:uncharacterized protein with von Willebrand factor type A (vWA) domain